MLLERRRRFGNGAPSPVRSSGVWVVIWLLKAEFGAEGDAQVVVGAVVEVDLVACFKAKAEGSEVAFEPGARIERDVASCAADTGNGIGEGGLRNHAAVVHAEVNESDLTCGEGAHAAGSGVEDRAKEAGERTDAALDEGGGDGGAGAGGLGGGEVAGEVIIHLSLDRHPVE